MKDEEVSFTQCEGEGGEDPAMILNFSLLVFSD